MFNILCRRLSHHIHTLTHRKLVGSYGGQIKTGQTHLEMPSIPIAHLQKSVMASSTGPLGGLCQLDPELDAPTHDHSELVGCEMFVC